MTTEDLKSLKDKAFDFIAQLTVKRLLITTLAGAIGIAGYTLWENRQKVFENQTISHNDDFELAPPSEAGRKIVQALVDVRPEILMVTLIDANPVTNYRTVVHRWFGDTQAETDVLAASKNNPRIGDGPLFNTDSENNKQVLAVLSGEFYCAPVSGIILQAYPTVAARVKYSCRIPLPPAFGKATGWFAAHLNEWPPKDFDNFKNLMLMMSLTYYNSEILKETNEGLPSQARQ